ncbi:MAG: YihY/virulence factor BrkB family protein [Beijerinckiaceae bacterium]|nr:YihY/virulence factor BrkB family protein [Beijerinckiaceae bacterium]
MLFSKKLLLVLGRRLVDDNVFTGAAALSFYMTLAFFPALVVMITLVPFLPIPRVEQAIFDFLAQGLPDEASGLVRQVVEEAIGEQRGGLLSFSLLAAAWAASTGMYGVMRQINSAYEVSEARSFLRARAVSLLLSTVFGAMILTAFSLIVLGGIVQDWLGSRFGFNQLLLTFFATLRWVIIVVSMLLGFALVYRFAPNVEQRFGFVTPGSVFGVVALILVSLGFSVYIQNFGDYGAMYGSIGAVVVLMLWFYAAAFVIIAGAEINALMHKMSQDEVRK